MAAFDPETSAAPLSGGAIPGAMISVAIRPASAWWELSMIDVRITCACGCKSAFGVSAKIALAELSSIQMTCGVSVPVSSLQVLARVYAAEMKTMSERN